MANKAIRGGGGPNMPKLEDPKPAAGAESPPHLASDPQSGPTVPPRPGRSPEALAKVAVSISASAKKDCEKCNGNGKYAIKDRRGFVSYVYCECVGGGPVKVVVK